MLLFYSGTDTEYKDFTHLLDVVVNYPVQEVALTQQYLAYAGKHQLHCFKLTFGDWTQDKVGVKTTPRDIAQAANDHALPSLEGSDEASASHGHIDKSASSGHDGGKESGITWNFGSAGYTIPETFMKPVREPCKSSILLSSVKHEKLYHDDTKDPVEVFGPKEKVKGHPVQVKWDEVYLYR